MGKKISKEEKERLMNEVLGKKRPSGFDSVTAKEYLETKTDAMQTEMKKQDVYNTVMAPDTTAELNDVLKKQQEELNKMSEQMGFSEEDYEKLQKEIQADFGVMPQDEVVVKKIEDTQPIFDEIENKLNEDVIAQTDSIHNLIIAFRRPYVLGDNQSPKNTILISGPNGAGRHSSIAKMARYLYEKQVFISDEVYNIDMSLYSSSSQEQIFLQDLYMALQGNGSVICIENFEVGYPPYLRMLNDLVCNGKIILNKRYVLQKGQLIEAQTGLASQVVNTIDATDKYLVFITDKKISKVIDSFGTTFTDHVKDQIIFNGLDKEEIKEIIAKSIDALQEKVAKSLGILLDADETVFNWINENYKLEEGAEYVMNTMNEFYDHIVQCVLVHNKEKISKATIKIVDNTPKLIVGESESYDLIKARDDNADLIAVKEELKDVVGLQKVKDYIYQIEDHIKVQELRKKQGLKTTEVSKHMIFTGNPGTGKTTIARLLSRYMKAIGALSQGQLVEVTRADLVGKYVGHTAPLTMSVIKSAIGGVLFIDEAYSLYRGKDDSFGLEAIDTIVKAMEDNRDDLIIILAGYSKEMETFLEANSGLKSRFPNIIHFDDYTGQELMDISKVIAKQKEYKILDEVVEPLTLFYTHIQATNAKESGNGRLARNKVEEAILSQSSRLLKEKDANIDELKLVDFDLTEPSVQ